MPEPDQVEISIIIVNYKTPKLTLECVKSIFNHNPSVSFEVIIVDNHSEDDSKDIITKQFPYLTWIDNGYNAGFGRANNIGAEQAQGRFILFLNSDIILHRATIDTCLRIVLENPTCGVLGCELINDDGTKQKSVYNYAGDIKGVLKDNLIYDYFFKPKSTEVKAVMGAFMFIPKTIFESVNGFDPDFFMYAEELELCHRIRQKNYRIQFTNLATAQHKHGASSGNSKWSIKQNYLSNALLYLKVGGIKRYILYHLLSILNFLTNFSLLWKMDRSYRAGFWVEQSGYFSNFAHYFLIPFHFSKHRGDGRTMLKRS